MPAITPTSARDAYNHCHTLAEFGEWCAHQLYGDTPLIVPPITPPILQPRVARARGILCDPTGMAGDVWAVNDTNIPRSQRWGVIDGCGDIPDQPDGGPIGD